MGYQVQQQWHEIPVEEGFPFLEIGPVAPTEVADGDVKQEQDQDMEDSVTEGSAEFLHHLPIVMPERPVDECPLSYVSWHCSPLLEDHSCLVTSQETPLLLFLNQYVV